MEKTLLRIIEGECFDFTSQENKDLDTIKGITANYEMLNNMKVHMYLASYTWKNASIELSETAPISNIEPILSKCENIKFVIKGIINPEILGLICNAYPDKKGELRRSFMKGNDLSDIINIEYCPR